MRYEEIILGQISCEEAPQVVPAWYDGMVMMIKVFSHQGYYFTDIKAHMMNHHSEP